MRETVHKIMSPNNKLIPYKDWTTTGQCLAIKSLLCGVSIGFSILICDTYIHLQNNSFVLLLQYARQELVSLRPICQKN